MMRLEMLDQVAGKWLHVQTIGDSQFYDQAWQAARERPRYVSRVVRGHKARTTGALFDEFAAALQFPWYFGENWDALDECLADLEWLPGDGYVIWIAQAARLLEHEPRAEFARLLKLLAGAAATWHAGSDQQPPSPAKPFHVVLQSNPQDEPALVERLAAAEADFNHWAATG
jgi:hypothetical protein